jgi:hypothetical protein
MHRELQSGLGWRSRLAQKDITIVLDLAWLELKKLINLCGNEVHEAVEGKMALNRWFDRAGSPRRAYSVYVDNYDPFVESIDSLPAVLRRVAQLLEYEATEGVTIRDTKTARVLLEEAIPSYIPVPADPDDPFDEPMPENWGSQMTLGS